MFIGIGPISSQTRQSATVKYNVQSGDNLVFSVVSVDAGFNKTTLDVSVGDTYTISVISTPGVVSATLNSGSPETLQIHNSAYFSYVDFSGNTGYGSGGFLMPISCVLSNGTALSIGQIFPLISPPFTNLQIDVSGNTMNVYGYLDSDFVSMIYDAVSGVLMYFAVTDSNGLTATITGPNSGSSPNSGGSGSQGDINAVLQYQPSEGSVFTFQVTRRDANFNTSDFEENIQLGDIFKFEVLQNLNISAIYHSDYNYLEITDTGNYLKFTYPNGTSELDSYQSNGLIQPTEVDLANGTILNLYDALNMQFGDLTAIQDIGSSYSVNLNFGFNATLLYSKNNGVLQSESITDTNGYVLTIEEGSYISTHGSDINNGGSNTNSATLPLPINTGMIFTTFAMLALLTYYRKFSSKRKLKI